MKLVNLMSTLDQCKIRVFDYYMDEKGGTDPLLNCLEYCCLDDNKSPITHIKKWSNIRNYFVKFVTCNADYIYIFVSKYER